MRRHAPEFPYELDDIAITGIFDTDIVPDLAAVPDDSADPELAIHQNDMRRIVGLLLRELDPREERLLRMQFGIGVDETPTAWIVMETDIPKGQVRGALIKGLRRLKHGRRGRILRMLLRDMA